ncbi:MAG: hypothetical protein WBQ94_22135, partial [Terracidiphilus sp.]
MAALKANVGVLIASLERVQDWTPNEWSYLFGIAIRPPIGLASGPLYAAREENRGQLALASRTSRSSTPASPINTLDAHAGQLIAQLPTTLQ